VRAFYIYDDQGRRILDGLSGLFVVQVGHGRRELAEVAAKQAEQLAYFPIWVTRTRRRSIWLSGWPDAAPGDLTASFFTTGGGEAVRSAWKGGQAVLQADRQAAETQG